MVSEAQREKADALLALHSGRDMLALPNVWDPIGARVLEKKGYPAVATAPVVFRACLAKFVAIAEALRADGDYSCLGGWLNQADLRG